jgi:2-methylisocitrate lyase-like PEP mutase family enzyme
MKTKRKIFKELLARPGMIVAPGAHDATTARVIQKAGFEAFYMTGNGVCSSRLGVPDIGIASATQMHTWAHNLNACVDIPLICDADNGYGGMINTWQAIRGFEDAGVCAVHIEDQDFPKKCGCYAGVKLVDPEIAEERIRVAVKAKRDLDFLIIARSDARRAHNSLDEAIERGKRFEKAGADILFFEQLESREEILKITKSFNNIPIMYDILEERKDLVYTIKEIENLGVKICIFALSSILYTVQCMMDLMKTIKETGTTISLFDKMMNLHDYEDLMGIKEFNIIADCGKVR